MGARLTPRKLRRVGVLCLGGGLLVSSCGNGAPVASTQALSTGGAAVQPTTVPRRQVASVPPAASVARPRIVQDPIPFPSTRKREMIAYARRHYGLDTYRLIDPRVIVEHYTETPDFQSTYNTFAPDHPDTELHELPNTCVHFVVDRGGVIHQLVPLGIMCRHTVGLNYTAIGIENVGYSDQEILRNPAQMRASLALTRWLRCSDHIAVKNVIGHSESLSSPYHHENVPSLRGQTHSDWQLADMNIYRARLRSLPCR
ncbi:MAG TPA: peptidoglycan recognition family protein [Solirubrobacteraceae bacterium]|jgi:beta-N-acetylhexosaminidase